MKLKIFIIFSVFALAVIAAVHIMIPTQEPDTYNRAGLIKTLNQDVVIDTNDLNYTVIPVSWFSRRGIPFVAQFFSDNKIYYIKEVMDCENLAELFISLLNVVYFVDHRDSPAMKKAQIMVGHIITKSKADGSLHDAVILYLNDNWYVIEPMEFLILWVDNPSKISDAMKTISQVQQTHEIQRFKF